jgi:ceramide glucosyltransferase
VLVVNDADIVVPKDYLRRVVAPLGEARNGLVTCLYRPTAGSLAGQFEAVGIATDFIPSALVAPMVGVSEFGFGSTLAFRATDLAAIGGFAAVREYLADDYQLARRLTGLGKGAVMSEVVVRTTLGSPSWRDVWRHQVRWARTIRVSRGRGYAGLPITHAGVWIFANLAVGNVGVATALWLARAAMGAGAGFLVLRHWPALLVAPLLPLWDLWAFVVWMAGAVGRSVWWRGEKLRLERDGRITP